MAAPSIKLYETDDATGAIAWDAGTVKAGTITTDLDPAVAANTGKRWKEIHVWNNKGTASTPSTAGGNNDPGNMINCTVTTLTADGTDDQSGSKNAIDYEHIQGGWIEVNVNDESKDVPDPSNAGATIKELVWHKIGGNIAVTNSYPGPFGIRSKGHTMRADGTTPVNLDSRDAANHNDIEDDVIESVVNNGDSASGNDDKAFADLKFRINLADGDGPNANPGTHTYKIRIQGYYI